MPNSKPNAVTNLFLPKPEAGNASAKPSVVVFPCAPWMEQSPALTHQNCEAIRPLLKEITDLHYAAFISLYGPPPETVFVTLSDYVRPDGLVDDRYCARSASRDHNAIDWLDAFAGGLSFWREACFQDPTDRDERTIDNERIYAWSVGSFQNVTRVALNAMKRRGRQDLLRNLQSYLLQRRG